MDISPAHIQETHQELWKEAIEEYGDKFSVPFDVIYKISARTRALHVLQVWNGAGPAVRFLSAYGIPVDIVTEVLALYCNEEVDESDIGKPQPRRADKYDAFLDWTTEHVYEQFTTEQLVEQSGFSYPTTLKFISETANFHKVKKGVWELRDPKAEREKEKNS